MPRGASHVSFRTMNARITTNLNRAQKFINPAMFGGSKPMPKKSSNAPTGSEKGQGSVCSKSEINQNPQRLLPHDD